MYSTRMLCNGITLQWPHDQHDSADRRCNRASCPGCWYPFDRPAHAQNSNSCAPHPCKCTSYNAANLSTKPLHELLNHTLPTAAPPAPLPLRSCVHGALRCCHNLGCWQLALALYVLIGVAQRGCQIGWWFGCVQVGVVDEWIIGLRWRARWGAGRGEKILPRQPKGEAQPLRLTPDPQGSP